MRRARTPILFHLGDEAAEMLLEQGAGPMLAADGMPAGGAA